MPSGCVPWNQNYWETPKKAVIVINKVDAGATDAKRNYGCTYIFGGYSAPPRVAEKHEGPPKEHSFVQQRGFSKNDHLVLVILGVICGFLTARKLVPTIQLFEFIRDYQLQLAAIYF